VLLVNSYNLYKYSDKWTKNGVIVGTCLSNNQCNFQLHKFTTNKNIAKSFFLGGGTFLTHTIIVRNKTVLVSYNIQHLCNRLQRCDTKYDNTFITAMVHFVRNVRGDARVLDLGWKGFI